MAFEILIDQAIFKFRIKTVKIVFWSRLKDYLAYLIFMPFLSSLDN